MPIVSTAQFNVNTSLTGDQTAPVSLMLAKCKASARVFSRRESAADPPY